MTQKEKDLIIDIVENTDINWIHRAKQADRIYNETFGAMKLSDTQKNERVMFINNLIDSHYENFIAPCLKKYAVKENTINSSIVYILEMLVKELNKEVPTQMIYEVYKSSFENPDNKDLSDMIKKSLNYIKCLLLADYRKQSKFTFYKINIDKWFEERRYYVENKKILKVLLPLLVGYVKSEKICDVDNFFEVIDKLIKYIIQPYQNTNSLFNMEYKILQDILHIKKTEMSIFDKNSRAKKPFKTIKVKPKRIIFNNDNSRSVEYINSNGDIQIIDIKDIRSITATQNTQGAIQLQGGTKFYLVNELIDSFNIKKEYTEEKIHKIILEVPTSLFEYFRLKPLQNQTMYYASQMIKEFEEVYGIKDTKESYFYVVATDTIENTSSIILHTLDNVKIIEPSILTDTISQKIEQFKLKH